MWPYSFKLMDPCVGMSMTLFYLRPSTFIHSPIFIQVIHIHPCGSAGTGKGSLFLCIILLPFGCGIFNLSASTSTIKSTGIHLSGLGRKF